MDVSQFHNLSHLFISLIGAVLTLAIYYNIRKRFKTVLEEEDAPKRVDKGLLNLSLALFVWVASGLWAYLGIQFDFSGELIYQIGVNLLSILNNLFLLFAISYFYHAPSFITNNEKNLKRILAMVIAVTVLTFMVSYFNGNHLLNGVKVNAIPDLVLSGFICFLLLTSLYKTFIFRDLKWVAYISVVVVLLIFVSQLPEVFVNLSNDFTYSLIRIIAKTSLISIFLLLATTWVIQLASTPRITEMQIHFKDWSIVELSIPSKNINQQEIDFGAKATQYKNLLKLAIRRKHGQAENQSIIIGAGGEIKNQTYLSRIIDNINQILNIEGEDKLDRRDLFTFIGEGKYRLRILPAHIKIEKGLLSEFVNQPDNQVYKSICN